MENTRFTKRLSKKYKNKNIKKKNSKIQINKKNLSCKRNIEINKIRSVDEKEKEVNLFHSLNQSLCDSFFSNVIKLTEDNVISSTDIINDDIKRLFPNYFYSGV